MVGFAPWVKDLKLKPSLDGGQGGRGQRFFPSAPKVASEQQAWWSSLAGAPGSGSHRCCHRQGPSLTGPLAGSPALGPPAAQLLLSRGDHRPRPSRNVVPDQQHLWGGSQHHPACSGQFQNEAALFQGQVRKCEGKNPESQAALLCSVILHSPASTLWGLAFPLWSRSFSRTPRWPPGAGGHKPGAHVSLFFWWFWRLSPFPSVSVCGWGEDG